MIITIYIDDFFICDVARLEINKVKNVLKAKFQISDLAPVSFYLDMAVTRYCANCIFCLGQ